MLDRLPPLQHRRTPLPQRNAPDPPGLPLPSLPNPGPWPSTWTPTPSSTLITPMPSPSWAPRSTSMASPGATPPLPKPKAKSNALTKRLPPLLAADPILESCGANTPLQPLLAHANDMKSTANGVPPHSPLATNPWPKIAPPCAAPQPALGGLTFGVSKPASGLTTTAKSPSAATASQAAPHRAPPPYVACAPRAMSSTCAMPLTPSPNLSSSSTAQSSKPRSSFDHTQNSCFEGYTTQDTVCLECLDWSLAEFALL